MNIEQVFLMEKINYSFPAVSSIYIIYSWGSFSIDYTKTRSLTILVLFTQCQPCKPKLGILALNFDKLSECCVSCLVTRAL